MAVHERLEVPESNIVLGLDSERNKIVMQINDVVEQEWDAYDTHHPPCCAICLEDGHDVEPDGRCPHGKHSYLIRIGMM